MAKRLFLSAFLAAFVAFGAGVRPVVAGELSPTEAAVRSIGEFILPGTIADLDYVHCVPAQNVCIAYFTISNFRFERPKSIAGLNIIAGRGGGVEVYSGKGTATLTHVIIDNKKAWMLVEVDIDGYRWVRNAIVK